MGLSVDPWTRGEAMRALTSIPVVRYAQFPVVPRRLGEGSSRPEGDLQGRRNEGAESERKRSSAEARCAKSGRTFKSGRLGPDGTPREGWRGLPIRNAIRAPAFCAAWLRKETKNSATRKAYFSGQYVSGHGRRNPRTECRRLQPSPSRCASHVIGVRFRNIWPFRPSTKWTASPLRKNSLIATETRRKTTTIRNLRAGLESACDYTGDLSARNRVTPGKEEEAAPMEHIDRREVLLAAPPQVAHYCWVAGLPWPRKTASNLSLGPISRRRCRRRRRRW